MIKNICIIEDSEDFEIIFKRVDLEDCLFIPLDLKTFLICKKNKVNIFNFKENLTNEFHEIALEETKKFIENLKFKKKISYSLRSEIVGYLRFRLHSIIFIIEIIEQILDKYKIDKIIVSGITKQNHKLHNAKICSEIVNELYPDLSKNLINNHQDEKYKKIYTYVPDRQLLRKSKKILLGNGGYNLKRLNKRFRKKGFTTWLTFFKI